MATHAKLIRELKEEHPTHAAFMLVQIEDQAHKFCGCFKLSCEVCGTAVLLKRARKIEQHSKIAMGYLSGGKSNPRMTGVAR